MKRVLIILLVIAALGAAGAGAGKGSRAKSKRAPSWSLTRMEEGRFSVEFPRAWKVKRDARRDRRRKIYSVGAEGPRARSGASVRILVRYYAPGNRYFKNLEEYIARQYDDEFPRPEGVKTGPLAKTRLAGRSAKRFSRDTFEMLPPDSMDMKEIPMREEHVLLDHAGGFYILSYVTPKSLHKKHRGAFQHALASFRVLKN